MIKKEIHALISEQDRLLRILRADRIQHSLGTKQSLVQAREIWLFSVLKELCAMGEYWSILHTAGFSLKFLESCQEELLFWEERYGK